jgi:hypothetical protein
VPKKSTSSQEWYLGKTKKAKPKGKKKMTMTPKAK